MAASLRQLAPILAVRFLGGWLEAARTAASRSVGWIRMAHRVAWMIFSAFVLRMNPHPACPRRRLESAQLLSAWPGAACREWFRSECAQQAQGPEAPLTEILNIGRSTEKGRVDCLSSGDVVEGPEPPSANGPPEPCVRLNLLFDWPLYESGNHAPVPSLGPHWFLPRRPYHPLVHALSIPPVPYDAIADESAHDPGPDRAVPSLASIGGSSRTEPNRAESIQAPEQNSQEV